MRCLFCKKSSAGSRSEEHIVPESLGNTQMVLPPGIVCDKCNNYFSREVEKPFLASGAVVMLRFEQDLVTKRGRLVGAPARIAGEHPATVYKYPSPQGELAGIVDVHTPEGIKSLSESHSGLLLFSEPRTPPDNHTVSRFLAKAALEAMAARLLNIPGGMDYLIDDKQLDPLRDHARIGDPNVRWPHHARHIHDPDKSWLEPDGRVVQRVHEHDFLVTNKGEWYFVLSLFGLELTINIAGPVIRGYEQWIAEHNGASPLYYGKNAP